MKNEELAAAATELWMCLEQVICIYRELEDDDGGLGRANRVIEKKFSHVMEWLEDLVVFVNEAAKNHAEPVDIGPPWARNSPTEGK